MHLKCYFITTELFRFKVEWLKNGYSDKKTVERDREKLGDKVADALLGVHKRHRALAKQPSGKDIQLLKQVYGGTYVALDIPSFQWCTQKEKHHVYVTMVHQKQLFDVLIFPVDTESTGGATGGGAADGVIEQPKTDDGIKLI